jgi:fatty-acyl-CoA synthase
MILLGTTKAPKRVVFGPLPKTGTGKIMKYALRAQLEAEREAPCELTSSVVEW